MAFTDAASNASACADICANSLGADHKPAVTTINADETMRTADLLDIDCISDPPAGTSAVLCGALIAPGILAQYIVDIDLKLCKHYVVLSKKELLILEQLVSDGPLYGLQLVERSGGALKRGTVYVTLGRMEAKGIVESEQEMRVPGAIGLPRRIYRPTALGERLLRAWATFTREIAEVKP